MVEYPPSPTATFRVLKKLDLAFASLLQGVNVESGARLPGFERGPVISVTEKVRIKSLVEQTRVKVVNVMSAGGTEASVEDDGSATETDTEDSFHLADSTVDEDAMDDEDDYDEVMGPIETTEMGIAKVYDHTMVELGDMLGGTPIGIITDS